MGRNTTAAGPLQGLRIVEFAGLGPCPLAGMLLADMGADVIVIERAAAPASGALQRVATDRNKRSIALNLKHPDGLEAAWRLLESADALIEGFRPGVMERLGLGPDAAASRNPRLVYGRVTGWGQSGPLAQAAGHDLNYVALTGALDLSRRDGAAPTVPPSLVGDMGGGAMFLAFGLVCALMEAQRSGRGQVVDAAMVDGVAALSAMVRHMRGSAWWPSERSHAVLLGSAPFYDAYECADGRFVTLAALEPPFYAELLRRLGLDDVDPAQQHEHARWPALKERIAALMRTQPRAHWCALLEGSDACFAPVLDLQEAETHPHNTARGVYVNVAGEVQPAAAPRFSRTPGREPAPAPRPGEHGAELLRELGYGDDAVAALRAAGACA
ncbi:CaiB/BaiF CoA transferase family protein [Azohydromonas lata]|uniref:CaiB/BaiF CoA-transferase family protein n=1 Tax=Azohydromonas lata TaxID=45677 RepID=A0ABU5IDQ5_9BURK|nr:CaiB/BaiF CoA-transferase family protein [Azohydromonas lata]MDZ5456954.1 CaiB/BaiF CoA-transferase family protein [Azohydromonas lata]